MDKHFICLANSYKRGGRCIAGIIVTIKPNGQWVKETTQNGSPKWIRPIDKNTEYGEVPEHEARYIPLLSIVKLTNVEPCPHQSHSEDVFYKQILAIGMIQPTSEILGQLTDKEHTDILYNRELAISPEEYSIGNYSLMMIHPETYEFQEDLSKKRAKYRLKFSYHNTFYDFSVTDPIFYDLISKNPNLIASLKDFYLVLSIGLVYEGRHHKLVAGIIIPPSILYNIEPYAIIYTDSIQKMSTREFTSSERSSIKKAFVVPSQQGMSVCIKKKNGDEEFYLIDSSYHAKPWEKVNLKKALLTTYKEPMGKEFVRISLQPTRKNIFQVIKSHIYILLNIQSLCHSRNSGLGRYFWGVVNFLCRIGSKY